MTALLEARSPGRNAAGGNAGSVNPVGGQWSKRTTWVVRSIGIAAVVSIAATVWLGLWVTPPDKVQGNLVRLVYVHPPIAWVALYLSFGMAFVASLLWLWKRTRSPFWDRLAGASMEVSVVFTALTLLTGSIWGRPTWGVWWAWDARLTSTAMLLVMELGYLAIRRVPGTLDARARRCAVATLITAVDVPIVHFSVIWWHTLHQGATVLNANLSPTIHGSMAWTLLLGFVAFTLAFIWMLCVRMRIETLTDELEGASLALAIDERWSEGTETAGVGVPSSITAGTAGTAGAPGSARTAGTAEGGES
jgi:heme exporter protein C